MFPVVLSLLAPEAAACGGFACDNNQPVLQAAERVLFGVDRDDDEVEMHVQVTYEGPSEDFAWIVPAPTDPEIFLTTGLLFTALPINTQPTFNLQFETEGTCKQRSGGLFGSDDRGSVDTAPSSDIADTGGYDYYDVDVLDRQALGPYLIVELQAASVDDLTGWLQENGFDIPDDVGPMLEPYLLEDAVFVALKLNKNSDVGDLAPLGMRFSATEASIPVQLTAMAAVPDMPMEVHVFSDGRAVPKSYLHVQINDAAIDWWNQGANYLDVISQAADEAGGHAFATDYHGTADVYPTLFDPTAYNREGLVVHTDPVAWMDRVNSMLIQSPPELLEVVELHVPSVDPQSFVQCPGCASPVGPFDPVAATDDLELMVIEPLTTAQALLDDHPFITRLTSSLDAAEMTVDPTFVVNDDLEGDEIGVTRTATLVTDCTKKGTYADEALRHLDLADGRQLWIPSETWMQENNTTPFEFLQEHGELAAQVIEQMDETGSGEVLTDHGGDLKALAEAHNADILARFGTGCGCTSAGAPASLAGLLAIGGLVGLRRRR